MRVSLRGRSTTARSEKPVGLLTVVDLKRLLSSVKTDIWSIVTIYCQWSRSRFCGCTTTLVVALGSTQSRSTVRALPNQPLSLTRSKVGRCRVAGNHLPRLGGHRRQHGGRHQLYLSGWHWRQLLCSVFYFLDATASPSIAPTSVSVSVSGWVSVSDLR